MAKVGISISHESECMINIFLQTVTGTASNFASCVIQVNENIPWDQFRNALIEGFSDLADIQYAKVELKKMKQHQHESVQTFSKHLLDFADEIHT